MRGDNETYYGTNRAVEKQAPSILEDADSQYSHYCVNSAVFTGKERDRETGFSYFGARYYDSDLSGLFLSVDPISDKYPSLSPYAYCAWSPVKLVDPDGRDSIHTPNGMANAGEGYKTTPDGIYLYGEGLQTKKWNPYLETGAVVGERGGYEDCDVSELNAYGIALSAVTSVSYLDDVVGVGSDGYFSYKRTKYDKLSHGTARNHIKPIGQSIPGKGLKIGGGAITILLTANDVRSSIQENGINSPETYSAIGGALGTGVSLYASTMAGASAGSFFGGIGAVPGAIIGFVVGVGINIGFDCLGRTMGETIYKKTH